MPTYGGAFVKQMSKSEMWQRLKTLEVEMPHHYREYSTEDLARIISEVDPEAPLPGPSLESTPLRSEPDKVAGLRQNTPEDDVRVDENGLTWYQDEVRKPSIPQPRGRRKITYTDPGVREQRSANSQGESETFEMPGQGNTISEAKITLPSYQVGIYRDPKMPMFRIHVYNNTRGFSYFDVLDFYGGTFDLVPVDIKTIYVANDLCFDIRTTVRAIQDEHRQLLLQKETAL